ncbi:MAG: hypothetical protein P8Y99_10235, partial [Calditrichaceae bacterium]
MNDIDERQKIIDNEHLNLLSLFHYISGGITIAFALFFGLYFIFILFLIFSISQIFSCRFFKRRHIRLFSLTIGIINLL